MAPRTKAAALHKPLDSESEPDFDSFDITENSSTKRESSSQKKRRPRGRPAGVSKVTKAGRKGRRQSNQTPESPPKRIPTEKSDPNPRSVAKGKGKSTQDEGEITLLEHQEHAAQPPSKSRGRPKATSCVDQESVTHPPAAIGNSTEVSPKTDEILKAEPLDPMAIDQDTRDRVNPRELQMSEIEIGSNSESTSDDLDIFSLRQRLRDLTKRHENLQTRHRDLQNIGVKTAENNFERLRKQTEKNSEVANKLISQLKEELITQSKITEQAQLLRQQLELSQTEADELRVKLIHTGDALSEARCEIKTISAKLAASRTNETNIKLSNNASKPTAAGNRAHQETMQVAQAKEDLYGDLTGLIVRGIKRGEKEDVFDCIQTGRNGSLHFKLALEKPDGNGNYEDVQFTYRPQLDTNRDSEVIEVLPDYLTEEITFPRPHASKFYTRVTKALTERMG